MFTKKQVEHIERVNKELNQGYTMFTKNRSMKLTSVYIPVVLLDEIELMVWKGRYINRSEAIRALLRDAVDRVNGKTKNTD